jgi:hypothetical protein
MKKSRRQEGLLTQTHRMPGGAWATRRAIVHLGNARKIKAKILADLPTDLYTDLFINDNYER